MPGPWIDQSALRQELRSFFSDNSKDLERFGRAVNQTFEVFVLASLTSWYKEKGWNIMFANPKGVAGTPGFVRLKFSTRGRPENYTYIECAKMDTKVQIRHQLRVATRFHRKNQRPPSNVVLDVAVIKASDLSGFSTSDYVENRHLITFAEAKHMTAFAELIAAFVGLVHEMQPSRLKTPAKGKKRRLGKHLPPFLYVSGILNRTAEGLLKTIERRKYDVRTFSRTKELSAAFSLKGHKRP